MHEFAKATSATLTACHANRGIFCWPCRQDLTAAKAAIEELFAKISDIRRKAEASEVMVQEICRDIRKLDFAKTHLTHTITALRRLAMLVNAVGNVPLVMCISFELVNIPDRHTIPFSLSS